MNSDICGAELVVRNLEAQGVRYVFGIPGAKVDRVFDALVDSTIKTIVCRHEQNAALLPPNRPHDGQRGRGARHLRPRMFESCDRARDCDLRRRSGSGARRTVPVSMRLKQTHQTLDTVSLCRPVTKLSAESIRRAAISRQLPMRSAWRSPIGAAAFVSLPADVMNARPRRTC